MITVQLDDLRQLALRFDTSVPRLGKQVIQNALRDAAKPLLIAAKQEVPVGKSVKYLGVHAGKYKSHLTNRYGQNSYDRGGATRRDMRLKIGKPTGSSVALVLVGVSKRKGAVGWRTHFIEYGTKRKSANPFLRRAQNRTMFLVEQNFMSALQKQINKKLAK
jgi:HK97 gp10 family phage protein